VSSFTDDLALLSEQMQDDLAIVDDSQAYPDALPPAPPAEGNYRAKIDFLGAAKDQAGNAKFQLGANGEKYPTLVFNAVIAEPVELEGKRLVSFERIYSKPFPRGGGMANGLADIVRSHDVNKPHRTVGESLQSLKELAEQATTFRVRIRWEAYDKDYADSLKAAIGTPTLTKEQMNSVTKQATIVGMKKFKQDPNNPGKYLPIVVHPISGNTLTANARISQYFPSNQEGVKLVGE
jgi:hypothetical protein